MTDKAYAVPLHEQLASVPRDARLIIDDADGMGTRFIPVGRMCHEAAEALSARLAQPEQEIEPDRDHVEDDGCPTEKAVLQRFWREHQKQEPVAYLCENAVGHKYFRWKKPPSTYKPIALYTAPPQREWQGLTDEELLDIADMAYANDLELLQTLQAKLKEKNHG